MSLLRSTCARFLHGCLGSLVGGFPRTHIRTTLQLVEPSVLLAVMLAFVAWPATAQMSMFGSCSGVTCPGGNVICNGSVNYLITELFFEPEVPFVSLKKSPPTWNEVEQLMNNPYQVASGAACNDARGAIPGN